MKKQRNEIDWKRCNKYLNDEILPQIKKAIEQKDYEQLRKATKEIEFDHARGKIILHLSKTLENMDNSVDCIIYFQNYPLENSGQKII